MIIIECGEHVVMLINIKLSEFFFSYIEFYYILRAPNVLHLLFGLFVTFCDCSAFNRATAIPQLSF